MTHQSNAPKPFRVIIAGGSIVGLSLALLLEKAGVDYVLLEKREIAPQLGASIGFAPHGDRIMEQMGIWDDVEAAINKLQVWNHFDAQGNVLQRSTVLMEVAKITNKPTSLISRRVWLGIVHKHIKDKSKIHTYKGITSYEETDEGVTVTADNGKKFEGSILVGADGIHSTIRSLMADKISKTDAEAAKNLREGFSSEYQCLFATSKNERKDQPGVKIMPECNVASVYAYNHSGLIAAGMPGDIYWFFFLKSRAITHTPNVPRFSKSDAEEVIKQYRNLGAGDGYTFGDLWDSRDSFTMAALEEGIIQTKWSRGRVVLLGDAVHKCTINPGLGGQLALEGICHFTNELIPLLKKNSNPTLTELTAAFEGYETKQRPRANLIGNFSGFTTRLEAQATWWIRLIFKWIIPWVSDTMRANAMVNWVYGGAPTMEWLPEPSPFFAADEKPKMDAIKKKIEDAAPDS